MGILRSIRTFCISALIALVLMLLIHQFTFPFFVSGQSMSPTYEDGDFCVGRVGLTEDSIHKGDVVVFYEGGVLMVKRVVATPGDSVWITDGKLYVNGSLSEWQFDPIEEAGLLSASVSVKEKSFFCMGDNRNHSTDSRDYGAVALDRIKCVVTQIVLRKGSLPFL